MNEPITLAQILTIPGGTAAVLLIVQLLKPLLPKFPTRWFALIVSVVLIEAATVLIGKTDVTSIFLGLLNSLVVCAAAMGTYEVTFAESDAAKKPPEV